MTDADPEVFEFDAEETGELLARMASLSETHEGWINLEPEVFADEEEVRQERGLLAMFSPPAPKVPLATWSPPPNARKTATIGLQHPTGAKAKLQLLTAGHPVPRGWTVLQDHVRRGLVVAVPRDVDDAEAVAWLLRAGALLSVIPVTGRWRAAVYAP